MCVSPKKHKHFCKISQKFNENVLKPPKKCIFLFVLCAFFGKSRPFSVLSPVNPLLRTCFLILNHFRIPVKTAFLPPFRQNSQKHRFPKASKTKREGQAPPLQPIDSEIIDAPSGFRANPIRNCESINCDKRAADSFARQGAFPQAGCRLSGELGAIWRKKMQTIAATYF